MTKEQNILVYYIRLSFADDDKDYIKQESNSITNQRRLILDYISRHREFDRMEVMEFFDDGLSGTNENRPSFQEMIRLVWSGTVKVIIVKDFSRFARNYVTLGDFIEQIFPMLSVRFIAINDNYDSDSNTSAQDEMYVAVKAILAAQYSKDLSKKMYVCNTQRMKHGTYLGNPPFGYIYNPEMTHYLPDGDAADTVRRIFALALTGMPRNKIAEMLNREGRLTPAAHNAKTGKKGGCQKYLTNQPLWDHTKVSTILHNPVYTGDLTMRKSKLLVPGSNKRRRTDPSEQFIKENAHEPLVSKEDFRTIQEMMPKQKGWNRRNQMQYPLKGIVRCGYCKRVMERHRKSDLFLCHYAAMESTTCLKKSYHESNLEQVILSCLSPLLQMVLDEEHLQRSQMKNAPSEQARVRRELLNAKADRERLSTQKASAYEDYVNGTISLEDFKVRRDAASATAAELNQRIEWLQAQAEELAQARVSSEITELSKTARKFLPLTKLTREMVEAFVEDIYLYDDRYEIHWKFRDVFERLQIKNGEDTLFKNKSDI